MKKVEYSQIVRRKLKNLRARLTSEFGTEVYFGRTIVADITGLKSTRASELIKLLAGSEVIVPVTGHGKGKYRFQ